MLKKTAVVVLAFVAVFVVAWCFAFNIAVSATDAQVPVALTSNRRTGNMTNISFDGTSSSGFLSWYSPMVSAWGDPSGYLNFDTSSGASFGWEFTFTPSAAYTYVIFPRYVVKYGVGNTDKTVVYSHSSPAISAGAFELVDSRVLENVSDGAITVDYSWELYRAKYTGTASTFIMSCWGPGLSGQTISTWSFPIFPPKAYKSDGSGSESSDSSSGGGSGGDTSGGGSGGDTSGGGSGGDCQQWNELNQRLNNIEQYLNGIGWDLADLKDKLFDEYYKEHEVSAAESKYAKAESDVNSIIDGMSIPPLDFTPTVPTIPGSGSGDGTIGTFMDFVGGLWWLATPLVAACGCWVASLILYGKHDVK